MTANSWLLISVATTFYFFIKVSTTSKIFLVLTWLNTNLELLIIGCNQATYVSRIHA